MADEPEIVAGRYQLSKLIGRGAVADVWEAHDQQLGRPCALKLIHTRMAADDDTRLRFDLEVQTLERIHHPNVVELYDAGIRRGGMPFLALELLRGRSLAHELARIKRIPPARARSIGLQVLAGLEAAHAAAVIHRDLKPANVVLVPEACEQGGSLGSAERGGEAPLKDRAVLVDFGLVALQGMPGITQQGSVVGSPSYIAPERLRGEPFDGRSDLYAVGVLLFEMLTGTRPFVGPKPEDTIILVMTSHAPYPSEVAPDAGIPRALEDVVIRALEKYPHERAASATAMAAELAAT